jgi:hypothetical protein
MNLRQLRKWRGALEEGGGADGSLFGVPFNDEYGRAGQLGWGSPWASAKFLGLGKGPLSPSGHSFG